MAIKPKSQDEFFQYLKKAYGWYTGGFRAFVIVLAILEQMGLPRVLIGFIFVFATVGLYAGIGIRSRTDDIAEYYVAGRRVPPLFNGMATAAEWISLTSFIGLAGTLYHTGYFGLAFIMGLTGGYCLVALLLAPYLRKFGQFTIPDFLGARYGGHTPRFVGILAVILCSFTYGVAQIYGVGIVTTRLVGVPFEAGIALGFGGILVCSLLGGMRAVTWTQVAQYIVLIVAYLTPVIWLSLKHSNFPIPQLAYGKVLEQVTEREAELIRDSKEVEVRKILKERADAAEGKLNGLSQSFEVEKAAVAKRVNDLKAQNAPAAQVEAAQLDVERFPKSVEEARGAWSREADLAARSNPPLRHADAFPGATAKAQDIDRRNFLALIFCLTVGTAAMPHILMRYYTTPSVKEARQSVTWSLFFTFLLYFTVPALAVLVKFDVYTTLVGSKFSNLPAWVAAWQTVDSTLMNITDVNRDGLVQLAEIAFGGDIILLAAPEIAGLPYVITGLVAAGGMAAALATANGLLLTIASALSHDLYFKMINPHASAQTRVTVSRVLLVIVVSIAGYVAMQKPADVLFLVSAAFSLAAAAFFPALVLGVFWKRANKWGATLGMLAGLSVTFYYMAVTQPWLRRIFNVTSPVELWWDIQPISAGIFGIPAGFAVIYIFSMLTPPPDKEAQAFVDHVRYPHLRGDPSTQST